MVIGGLEGRGTQGNGRAAPREKNQPQGGDGLALLPAVGILGEAVKGDCRRRRRLVRGGVGLKG